MFSVLGFLINLLTMLGLMFNNSVRQQITTPYIISVLFSDLLFCTFLLPILATRYYTRETEANIWPGFCSLFPFLFFVSLGAFILSLMSVTINRTLIIILQERSQKIINSKVRALVILLCWVLPVFAMIPALSETYGKLGLKPLTQSCTILPDKLGRCPKSFIYGLFVFIPILIMVICNIIIFFQIKRVSSLRSKETKSFICSILFVFLFFLMTIVPSWTVDYVDECFQNPKSHAIAYIFLWSGSIINPVIFLMTQPSYRQAVRGLICNKLVVAVQPEQVLQRKSLKMRIKTFRAKRSPTEDKNID